MLVFHEAFDRTGYADRVWIGMVAISLLCHALILSGVVFLPQFRFTPPHMSSAVEVDLVSLPQGVPQAQEPSAQGSVPAPVKEEPRPVEMAKKTEAAKLPRERSQEKPPKAEAAPPKETVSVAPEPLQVKRSLKKKSYNVSKVIEKAIAKMEKQAEKSRPQPVLNAIDKLEKEVKGTGVTTGAAAARGGMGKKGVELLDIYHAEIWHQIQKNWAFSEELAQGGSDLEAVVIVKIMKDGKIRDIWFERRSGNAYFDDSALKAVKKSDPLPPLPQGFSEPFYEVGFRFNPFDLKGHP